MSSNSQRSTLAKLMATENISVEHKNVPTASFNTKDRVLNLPIWKNASKDVYDLLVGHEVAHALWTPVEWSKEAELIDPKNIKAVSSYFNVVEDARIEKLIKRKFPGLRKNMFKGYAELLERDFFGTNGRELTSYKLIDRLNLHFKIGSHVSVPFSDDEMKIVKRIENLDSYDDVVSCVKDIYSAEVSETDATPPELEQSDDEPDEMNEDDASQSTESNDNADSEENLDADSEENLDADSDSDSDNELDSNVEESETQKSFNDALDQDRDIYAEDRIYARIPTVDSTPFIDNIKTVNSEIATRNASVYGEDQLLEFNKDFKKFLNDSNKTVNYLAKEFEMKKNAEQHARANISKTGVIDTNKLHSYKFNDDVFRRITSLPGGKNHGLIMFVDWSGSMSNDMGKTIRQTMILAMFCRKVNIPFDVYSFTDATNRSDVDEISPDLNPGDLVVSSSCRLRHYLSGDMRNKEFNETLLNMFSLAKTFDGDWGYYSFSLGNNALGSTPLNEAIILADDIYRKFKTKYRLEKVNVIFLTDGESNCINGVYNPESAYGIDSIHLGWYSRQGSEPRTFVIDPKTKHSIGVTTNVSLTDALLKHFEIRHETNVVGIFISPPNISRSFQLHIDPDNKVPYAEIDQIKKSWKKEKCLVIEHRGYSKFFMIKGGKSLSSDIEDFEVSSDASKAKIRNAFKKHLSSKLGNKVVLNGFIDIIS